MCFNPIRIKNPSYNPCDVHSHKYNYVPCGKCAACRDSRVKELQARCDFEFGSSDYCLFITFTYAPHSLPLVSYLDNGEEHKCSTWNQKHITDYLKRLRISMARKGYGNFRYLITCERGSNDVYVDAHGRQRRATARPHYHAVFFVRGDVAHKQAVMRLISDNWTYGHIKDIALPTAKGNVRSVGNCIKYVVKYAVKDSAETLLTLPAGAEIVSHNQRCSYNNMLPKMRCSQFIGLDWLLHTLNTTWEDITRINDRGMTYVDWKKVFFILKSHPRKDVIAQTFAKGQCLLLDGRTTSVPRYYFKNICTMVKRVDLGFRRRVFKNRHQLFDGTHYVQPVDGFDEFFCRTESNYNADGVLLGYDSPVVKMFPSDLRALYFTPVTSSASWRSRFGMQVDFILMFDKAARFTAAVRELSTRPLDSMSLDSPALGYLSPNMRNSLAFAMDYDLIGDYNSLSDEDISDEYLAYLHDEDSVSADMRRLAQAVRCWNCVKSSVARYANDLRYKNNMANVLETHPEYFLPSRYMVDSIDEL